MQSCEVKTAAPEQVVLQLLLLLFSSLGSQQAFVQFSKGHMLFNRK